MPRARRPLFPSLLTALAALATSVCLCACAKTYMEGNIDVADGDYKTAIARYEQTLAKSPDYDLGWLKLGYAYYKDGQYDKAIGAFDKAIALRPGMPDAEFFRALSYLGAGRTDQGFELLAAYKDPRMYGLAQNVKETAEKLSGMNLPTPELLRLMEKARDDGYCMELQDEAAQSVLAGEMMPRRLDIPLTDQTACVGMPH